MKKKERRAREKEKKTRGRISHFTQPRKITDMSKSFFEREKINPIKKL